jgi:hypothetical protein
VIDTDNIDLVAHCMLFGAIIGVVLGAIAGGWVVGSHKESRWQREVVTRGYAHYPVVDTLTGTTEFQWKK